MRTQDLKRFPQLGARYAAATRNGHYRIAYLVKDDGNIDILGVFHGALDITRYQL